MLIHDAQIYSTEWKVDMDDQSDTHRHLSHLIGLYPGYALTSYNESLLRSPDLHSCRMLCSQFVKETFSPPSLGL